MLTNLANYKIVTNTKGQKTFAKIPTRKFADNAVSHVASYTNTNEGVLPNRQKPTKSYKEESFYANNYQTTVYPQQVNFTSPISPQQNFTTFLESFVNTQDQANLRYKYKDIYYFDNICGTAVDLRSELPFSDFSLTGISDDVMLKKYEEAVNEIKPLQFLRRLLVDYFVYGSSAHWFLFDDQRKIFSSPIALDLNKCTFIQTPLLNDAPFIDYDRDETLTAFLSAYNDGDQRVKDYVAQRPALLKLIATSGEARIKLDPATTLYLERNDLSYSPKNTVSYYSRVLKYYEYEKRLFRGTLDLAEKRLKSILHIMIGNDTILPNSDTLAEISNAFKTANLDPTDAIVATHNYVQTNELRTPTDFWRWDESSDFINRGKMVALGINEQFLSGEMSYASLESALSVFLDQLLWDRTYVTDKVFNKMIFPYIAKENSFFVKDKSNIAVESSLKTLGQDIMLDPLLHNKQQDRKDEYVIPSITWHKSLKPKVDKEWLDTLSLLKDQGIPIPFRMWLTGAGVNVDELLSEYDVDSDTALETKAKAYTEKFGEPEDFSSNFDDSDFAEGEVDTGEEGLNVEEDPFKTGLSEAPVESESISDKNLNTEEELSTNPTTPQGPKPTANDNPQLFQGASFNPLGLKARKQLGDLNGEEVQERLTPVITDSYGKKRPASKAERASLDEKFNKLLATQLAEKDQKEIFCQKQQFAKQKERATKHIC